ncbi:MAG: hypothetical protein ACRDPL_08740 [Propionibacteriaceae bacterium]
MGVERDKTIAELLQARAAFERGDWADALAAEWHDASLVAREYAIPADGGHWRCNPALESRSTRHRRWKYGTITL